MRTLILFIILLAGQHLAAQTLTINFSGVRNSSGNLRIQFFDSKENFDKEKPVLTKTTAKTKLANGAMTVTYTDIKPGTYGIAILDDENNNQKMDYGMILPDEGFGFSDYYHTGMKRPDFNKFVFTLGSGASKACRSRCGICSSNVLPAASAGF